MTFNVENLFDTEDDPIKNDETFLPLTKKSEAIRAACRVGNNSEWRRKECMERDWNDNLLAMKMKRLTDVLKQVKNGQGPDILIMQEVENRSVLEKWRTEYLADFKYKPAILIEGPDERGIDVGMFTRLEIMDPIKLHTIPFQANAGLKEDQISPTRGILEATMKLPDGTPITVLGVHFPSQGAPTETRKQSLEFVNKIKSQLPADRLVAVGGDFNISSDEEVRTGYIQKTMAKSWGVSHMLGCDGCKGTYYYNGDQAWSFFDIFLISQNMLPEGQAPWKVEPKSIRIENSSYYQTNKHGSPARFDENRKAGVSDHWPLAFDIIKR